MMKSKRIMVTVDSHTCGETTRFVVTGLPKISGDDMWEKTVYCQENYDHLRRAVAHQPRGFKNVLGAILTDPCDPEADEGVIFFHAGGYFRSCGDSIFSACKTLLELGIIEKQEPFTEVKLDTAAGLLTITAKVEDNQVKEMNYESVPSFYQKSTILDVEELGKIHADIAYGGLAYAIVDSEEVGIAVDMDNTEELIEKGMRILNEANREVDFQHPKNSALDEIEVVQFSSKPSQREHDYMHANIFGDGSLCISPAGTSIGAKIATRVAKGEMEINQQIAVESPVNPSLVMKGKPVRKTKVGKFNGVVPELSTQSYIIGMNKWILEENDPIVYGFKT